MDLDGFKAVNDAQGHAAGDTLLIEIATRLTVMVRPTDTVARLGGDEFAVILCDPLDAQRAPAIAERLINALGEPVEVGTLRVQIGVSVGVALDGGSFYSANDLVNAADKAMYRAKIAGKNRVHTSTAPPTVSTRLNS